MIVKKIDELNAALKVSISYEYNLTLDKPGEVYSSTRERFILRAEGYKAMYLPTYQQVLDINVNDFERKEEE